MPADTPTPEPRAESDIVDAADLAVERANMEQAARIFDGNLKAQLDRFEKAITGNATGADADAGSDYESFKCPACHWHQGHDPEEWFAEEVRIRLPSADADAMQIAADALGYTCPLENIKDPELDVIPVAAAICAAEARALERAAQWHESCCPELNGPEYGLASEDERRSMRADHGFHMECATHIRAMISPTPEPKP